MEAREKSKTDTEARIIQAAEEEFLAKGLEGARTTQIAQRAGVTHAMLHYYFRTKELLFEQIITHKMQELGNLLLSVFVEGEMPLPERIRRGVEQHFDFVAANPSLPRFVLQEIYAYPDRYALMQSKMLDILKGMLHKLQRHIDQSASEGKTDWVDARMLMLDIISLNIFAFVSYPLVAPVFQELAIGSDEFLQRRKAEHVETILRRLNPRKP